LFLSDDDLAALLGHFVGSGGEFADGLTRGGRGGWVCHWRVHLSEYRRDKGRTCILPSGRASATIRRGIGARWPRHRQFDRRGDGFLLAIGRRNAVPSKERESHNACRPRAP